MDRITTYLINLKQDVIRRTQTINQLDYDYFDVEVVDAVYGKELSKEEIDRYCDKEAIDAHPNWLSTGAIGCALSHLKVYRKILASDVEVALVLEDDKIYPQDFYAHCRSVIPEMEKNEVVLLYYESPTPCEFSMRTAVGLSEQFQLLHPVQKKSPITTGAYLISRDAARTMAEDLLPIRVAADTWHYFIDHSMVKNFRCLYPMVITDANFKSSIGYVDTDSWRYRMTKFVDKHRIPVLNGLLKWRRHSLRSERMKFSVVDKPTYKDKILSE